MLRTGLATLAVVIAMLACGATEASAWVCRAGGVGVTTFGGSRSIDPGPAHVRFTGDRGGRPRTRRGTGPHAYPPASPAAEVWISRN